MTHVLLILVLLPLAGAGLTWFLGRNNPERARALTLVNVLISFALCCVMVAEYDVGLATQEKAAELSQLKVDIPWLGGEAGTGPQISFSLAVDGISLWMIALTGLLMVTSVLVSWTAVTENPAAYYALMLMLQAGLVGVFAAQDIILFYLFFEFTLIPLFFMIGLWGGHDRRWAARKFFIYTFAGSVLTFLGLLFIVLSHQSMAVAAGMAQPGQSLTFSIPKLLKEIPELTAFSNKANFEYWEAVSPWIFLALFAGFAIKVPLFPFHTWLPLAHVEAPTAGSVLLAGVLLKIGSYGFLRFALPMVPEACWLMMPWVAWLSLIGIIYGALLALAQDDIKKLVAYSSVSHMGFCMLGLFAFNTLGMSGGLLQMVNHGLSTGALFALVGLLYERYHTRDIEAYGGMTRKFPIMAFFFVTVIFSSIGLPGLNGFTGEITALMGMFKQNRVYAMFGLTGIILGAWYSLWLVQRTFFGKFREPILEHAYHGGGSVTGNATTGHAATGHGHADHGHADHGHADHGHADHGHADHGHGGHGHRGHDHGGHGHGASTGPVGDPSVRDMNARELAAVVPLVACMFWIGLFPQFFLDRIMPSVQPIEKLLINRRQMVMQERPVETEVAAVVEVK
jgi:NADH-quinone oxidoreductase subunit M